jgi:hypothetical protein
LFLCHLFGCFWLRIGIAGIKNNEKSWLSEFQDIGLYDQFIASIYFAVVTITTVGYGDISA